MREGKVSISLFLFGKRRNCIDLIFRVCVCVRHSNLGKGPQFLARFLSQFFCVKSNLDGRECGIA